MKLQLIAIGTEMLAQVTAAYHDYGSYFPKDMRLEITEIPASKRKKHNYYPNFR